MELLQENSLSLSSSFRSSIRRFNFLNSESHHHPVTIRVAPPSQKDNRCCNPDKIELLCPQKQTDILTKPNVKKPILPDNHQPSLHLPKKRAVKGKVRFKNSTSKNTFEPSLPPSSVSSPSPARQNHQSNSRGALLPLKPENNNLTTKSSSPKSKISRFHGDSINDFQSGDNVFEAFRRRKNTISTTRVEGDAFRLQQKTDKENFIGTSKENRSFDTEVTMSASDLSGEDKFEHTYFNGNENCAGLVISKLKLSWTEDEDDLPFDEQCENNYNHQGNQQLYVDDRLPIIFSAENSEYEVNVTKEELRGMKMLHHAHMCLSPSNSVQCPDKKTCRATQTLFNHIIACSSKSCKLKGCTTLKNAWNHYRACRSERKFATCELCQQVWT